MCAAGLLLAASYAKSARRAMPSCVKASSGRVRAISRYERSSTLWPPTSIGGTYRIASHERRG